ncbi:hypothetical protein PsW64_02836 [Pseudovibrio sp. W64]|uniref:DUF4274 domain-containing protein n=1 Tax=Pseudovibrio sp. W64 TaxID=1735583 RepID=UPI0007AEAE13|nr:DUF4274 domain-containing protein [Pseudovibrio sp. W64]KZK80272.1 hypothetical protein PsW64_02836 [Pseudovibrio sp. W64]
MDHYDVLCKWWADPEVLIIPADETDQIIEWLGHQTPDTWHQVVMNWNWDAGNEVLSWILAQDNCDKGTAAYIFLVEGVGHWLWGALADADKAHDTKHICRIVLDNWHRYITGELKHEYDDDIPDQLIEMLREKGDEHQLADTPLKEIMHYEGTRGAVSKYASEDGKIVIALDYWMKTKSLEITS